MIKTKLVNAQWWFQIFSIRMTFQQALCLFRRSIPAQTVEIVINKQSTIPFGHHPMTGMVTLARG